MTSAIQAAPSIDTSSSAQLSFKSYLEVTSLTNTIPILLINLDHREDRLQKIRERLGELPFLRFPAVYGGHLTDTECSSFLSANLKRQMSKNDIACFLSHRAVWQKMVDFNIPVVCVLEDDVRISNCFADYIVDDSWLPQGFDVIKIETGQKSIWLSRNILSAGGRSLHRLRSAHVGSAGYLVSLQGAQKLLSLSERPDRYVDEVIFELGISRTAGIRTYQMAPALCVQESVATGDWSDSDIAEHRALFERSIKLRGWKKLKREVQRLYQQAHGIIRRLFDEKMIVPFF